MMSLRQVVQLSIMSILFTLGSSVVSAQEIQGNRFTIMDGDVEGLIEAIMLANDERTHPGPDIITLAQNGRYSLTERIDDSMGYTGLPMITSVVTIQGNGARIERSNRGQVPSFRIFVVGSEGNLELMNMSIANGWAESDVLAEVGWQGDGGGVLNCNGVVQISESIITGNTADYYGGGIANSGEMIITDSTIVANTSANFGGGIDNFADETPGNLEIVDSHIMDNAAVYGGGVSNRGVLLIRNTTFSDNSGEYGGGVFIMTGTALVESTAFANNRAEVAGGGIVTGLEANVTISDSTFLQNNTGEEGGAIGGGGTVTIDDSTFTDNSASRGGAIGNEGEMSISLSAFAGNTSTLAGGAIRNYASGSLTVSDCTFSNNSAPWGGGIENDGDIMITASQVVRNAAGEFGGGLFNFGEARVFFTTFDANTAQLSGGGIYNQEGGTVFVNSCLLLENSAQYGGGMINYGGTARVVNSTFELNEASEFGGGINNAEGGTLTVSACTIANSIASSFGAGIDNSGHITVKNTIVADSVSGNNCDNTLFQGHFISEGNNLSTDRTCPGFAYVTSEELDLGPLLDNGGSSLTRALPPDSIALDAASDCTTVEGPYVIVDQRFVVRPQGDACDVGAFEAAGISD